MPKSKKQKTSEQLLVQQQQASLDAFKEFMGLQKEIFAQIKPFAEMLVKFGIDPIEFLASPQGQALLAPTQQAISGNFEQARTNLVDLLGISGFSTQSGVGAGPFANLLGEEALAQSGAVQNLIGQSLNLGLQGSNVMQGQQGVFNPTPYGQLGTQAAGTLFSAPQGPWLPLTMAGLGAAGSALSGFAMPKPTTTTPQ